MNPTLIEVGYKLTKFGKHAVSCSLTGFGLNPSASLAKVGVGGSASILALSSALIVAPLASAANDVSLVDGGELSGFMISGNTTINGTSSSALDTYQGVSETIITQDGRQTVFTGFVTEGGAGSGGGAGLGGVFFVDQGATLTLGDVVFAGNTVKGGTGGGAPSQRVGNVSLSVATKSVDVFSFDQALALPEISKSGSDYVFNTIDLSATGTGLLTVGTPLTFGTLTGNQSGTVASVTPDDKIVLSSSVTIDSSDITSVGAYVAPQGAGSATQGYTVSGNTIDLSQASDAQRAAVKDALESNSFIFIGDEKSRFSAASYDSDGKIETITLTDNSLDQETGVLDIISVSSFSAKQFELSGSTVTLTGDMRGFESGMELFDDDGNALGLTVDTVASDGESFTVSGDATALAALNSFEGRQSPVLSSTQIALNSPRSDFYDGATIYLSDIDKEVTIDTYDATTGVITLASALDSGELTTLTNLSTNGTAIAVELNNISAASGNTITVRAEGLNLETGMELQGSGIDDGTTITNVGAVDANGFVTLTLDTSPAADELSYIVAKSPLSKGGNLNGMAANSTGGNGNNGFDSNGAAAFFEGGEGQEGTRGYAGDDCSDDSCGVGGDGGTGGNGSDGMPINPQALADVIDATGEFIDSTGELAAAVFPDPVAGLAVPIPDPIEIAGAAVDLGLKTLSLSTAIYENVQWGINLSRGIAGMGGDGGEGGEGGGGGEFLGGGAGGGGGNGGEGALSITDGGNGGDGGRGGDGGFGAGGGQGGAGGEGGSTGAADGGDPGDGGFGGFAAGDGSNGNGLFGDGGSGFGGAIFVRESGTLNIQGNSQFLNNVASGGSSTNRGAAGDGAGAALFIMTGANVSLEPGLGNEIQFDDDIADNSSASYEGAQYAEGEGADLTIRGAGGLVIFNADNSYSGDTILEGATLQAELGAGIHDSSRLRFNGTGDIINDTVSNRVALSLGTVGTLLQDGDLSERRVGNDSFEIKWSGSGGFASSNVDGISVSLGETLPGVNQQLVWGADGFFEGAETAALTFGSEQSAGAVTFTNDVTVPTARSATVAVYNTGDASTSFATLSGDWDANRLAVGQGSDFDGTLYMSGRNSVDALHVFGGVLSSFDAATVAEYDETTTPAFGTILDSAGGQVALWNTAELNLHATETASAITVDTDATLRSFGQLTATDVVNNGTIQILNGSVIPGTEYLIEADTSSDTANEPQYGGVEGVGTFTTTSITNSASGMLVQEGAISASGDVENSGTWNVSNDLTLSVATLTGAATGQFCLEKMGAQDAICAGDPVPVADDQSTTVARTLTVEQSGDSTFGGVFNGVGSLVKTGAGELTLTNAQTFLGGLTVNNGAIVTGTDTSTDPDNFGLFADTLEIVVNADGVLVLNNPDTFATLTNSGTVNANAHQTVTSAATQGGVFNLNADFTTNETFSVTNTEDDQGVLTASGTLNVTGDHTLTATGGLVGDGDIIVATGHNFTLSQDTETSSTFYGTIGSDVASDTSRFTLTGGGELILAGETEQVTLSYLDIVDGQLSLDGSELLGDDISVDVAGSGALAIVDADDQEIIRQESIYALSGLGEIYLGRNTLNIDNGGSFEGQVFGTGSVNVANGSFAINNTLTSTEGGLMVSNAGGTTVSQGSTVAVDNVSVMDGAQMNVAGTGTGSGDVSRVDTNDMVVNTGASLHLGSGVYTAGSESHSVIEADSIVISGDVTGNGTLSAPIIRVTSDASAPRAFLRPGNSPGVQTFMGGTVTLGSNSTLEIEVLDRALSAGVGFDQVQFMTGAHSL
mgnify:CR=1 FL=1